MSSSNHKRRADYEGINGETAWVLVTDHFTGMQHGDTRTSKAAPVLWLKHFLAQYNPNCVDKYVYMDQGGELFNNPEIKNLFTKSGYRIYPTGADASNQNGPVERAHRSVGNTIRALLTGSGIDTKFWPYAFYHSIRLHNAIPTRASDISPLTQAHNIVEDLPTSEPSDAVYGFAHQVNDQLNLWLTPEKASFSDMYHIPPRIYFGMIPRNTVSR